MNDINIMDSDQRLVAGWASVEMVDTQGDLVPISELKKAFLALMDRGGHIIYGHQNYPVGKILQWEVREHPLTKALGVYMIVKINSGYDADNIVWQLVKENKLKGFSIGGKGQSEKSIIETDGVKKTVNVLRKVQLNEVSIVAEPANQLARIDQVAIIAKCEKCMATETKKGIDDNMGDCMHEIHEKHPEMSHDQQVAVCGHKTGEFGKEKMNKEEGAMTSGDAGNHAVYGDTRKPKDEGEDKEEYDDEDKDKRKGLYTLQISVNAHELESNVEQIVKDHIKRWAKDGLKITESDRKQDDRKDYEESMQAKLAAEITATTQPADRIRSLDELNHSLEVLFANALKMKGVCDGAALEEKLSKIGYTA